MKTTIFVAATAAAALAAGSASAQCDQRLQGLQGTYGDFFMSGNVGFDQGRPVLRDLRNAAIRLHEQGLTEACDSVVDAMEQTVAAYQTYEPVAGAATMGATTGGAGTVTTETTGAATVGTAGAATTDVTTTGTVATRGIVTRPTIGEYSPEQVQARAVPLAQSDISMNTDELQDRDIYSFTGEDVGDFEGMLISQGQPTHIIVSHGGFLNIGSNDVAIPVELVSWDPEWQSFVVPFTEDQLDEAPDYDRSADWDWTGNDRYWGQFRG